MSELSLYERFILEASTMDVKNFIFVALMFYIPFHFSLKAKTLFFRLLYSFFAFYMLFTMNDPRVIYDAKMIVGLGLLIPQIGFLVQWLKEIVKTLKMMSANAYYFFITLYYKLIRFVNWWKSLYVMFWSFFQSFREKDDGFDSEEFRRQQREYQQQEWQRHDEHERSEQAKDSQKKQRHKEQEQARSYQEAKREEKEEGIADEYAQFYSQSAYSVLGVSPDDDYATVKKAYRELIGRFHPDRNPENIKLYTQISQNINDAWDKVKRWKK